MRMEKTKSIFDGTDSSSRINSINAEEIVLINYHEAKPEETKTVHASLSESAKLIFYLCYVHLCAL